MMRLSSPATTVAGDESLSFVAGQSADEEEGTHMYLQDVILALHRFWAGHGCLIAEPYDVEKGAGTMNPHTFFRALGSAYDRRGCVGPPSPASPHQLAPTAGSLHE